MTIGPEPISRIFLSSVFFGMRTNGRTFRKAGNIEHPTPNIERSSARIVQDSAFNVRRSAKFDVRCSMFDVFGKPLNRAARTRKQRKGLNRFSFAKTRATVRPLH